MTNKNQQIAIKSSELLDKIKDLIIIELFDYNGIKSIDSSLGNLKVKNQNLIINTSVQFNNLNEVIMREINEENVRTTNFIKNKEMTATLAVSGHSSHTEKHDKHDRHDKSDKHDPEIRHSHLFSNPPSWPTQI